jgi:CRP/FNR family cyclic AMP-dependent transcriptional regulator
MTLEPGTLCNFPLFSPLSETECAEFSAHTQSARFEAHQTIYRAGDPIGSMYMVLVGRIRIMLSGRFGREIIIAELAPGALFGELPNSGGEVYAHTAVALIETHLIVLDRDNLKYLFGVNPDAALKAIEALEAHLRRLHALIRNPKEP